MAESQDLGDDGDLGADMPPDMVDDMADMTDMADMACEPLSAVQFCTSNNFMCGELTAMDTCTGEMRTEVCGESCSLPQTCLVSVDEVTMAAILETASQARDLLDAEVA